MSSSALMSMFSSSSMCKPTSSFISTHFPSWLPFLFSHSHPPTPLLYTGCNSRNVRDFERVLLRSNYTDITQNPYIQIWTVTEIMAIEMCELLRCRRTVRLSWCHTCPMRLPGTRHGNAVNLASALQSTAACGKVLGSLRTTMTRVRVFLQFNLMALYH